MAQAVFLMKRMAYVGVNRFSVGSKSGAPLDTP